PSRPLNFLAQIGVLGKGNCKASLRCPAHVTIPFPAVFYSYGTGNGKVSDSQPSPYVGHIDIENILKPSEDDSDGKRRRRYATPEEANHDFEIHNGNDELTESHNKALRRKREKLKKRSQSPKSPFGGSYRIPQIGQLQIVIKNPNKTAVKLFLVPYDLSDMEPGQKTFIRQRSYSAGPIIDMPLTSRTNLGTDRPEAAICPILDDPMDRPMLRYLIHLHICCTGKGRYYLYKSVRVVFANRVPDGKEKLRNEVQLPDPRYSVYKPTRDSVNAGSHFNPGSSAGAHLVAEKENRRRSAGVTHSYAQNELDDLDGLRDTLQHMTHPVAFNRHSYSDSRAVSTVQPIPFNLTRLDTVPSRPESREQMDIDSPTNSRSSSSRNFAAPQSPTSPMTVADARSPVSPHSHQPFLLHGATGGSTNGSAWPTRTSSLVRGDSYGKLSKEDPGFGGVTSPNREGLLAMRLRGLDMQKP
ncbi:hypothetical protein LTS18_012923, partial [Coniosporium uncinatum]